MAAQRQQSQYLKGIDGAGPPYSIDLLVYRGFVRISITSRAVSCQVLICRTLVGARNALGSEPPRIRQTGHLRSHCPNLAAHNSHPELDRGHVADGRVTPTRVVES